MSNQQSGEGFKPMSKEWLSELCLSWSNKSLQQQILRLLNSYDRSLVFVFFDKLLRDPDLEVRDSAIKVLMAFDPKHGVDLLIPLLADPIESWRWYICGALADYGDQRAIEPLIQVLLNDPDDDTRYMAAVALENIGDSSAISALQHTEANDKGTDYEGRRISSQASKAITAIMNRLANARPE